MSKLYTGSGDEGYTDTFGGERVLKSDAMIELIGTLDEFSAVLGVAKVHTQNAELKENMEYIQKQLIGVMGELSGGKIFACENGIHTAEEMTDRYCEGFDGFVISGINSVSAFLNLARCVVRRAERVAAKLYVDGKIRKTMLSYLNRMSDLIYAMSRRAENE